MKGVSHSRQIVLFGMLHFINLFSILISLHPLLRLLALISSFLPCAGLPQPLLTHTHYTVCVCMCVSVCVCVRERVYGWGGERETQVGFVCSRGNDAGTTKAPAKTPFSWGLSPSLSLWLLLYSLHAPPLTHTNTHIHTHKHRGMHTHIRACLTQSQAALSCVNKSETSTEIQLPDEAAHPANKHTH